MKKRKAKPQPWYTIGSTILFQLYDGRKFIGRVTAIKETLSATSPRRVVVRHGYIVNTIDESQILDVLKGEGS